jgi:hypothetical protein
MYSQGSILDFYVLAWFGCDKFTSEGFMNFVSKM